MILKVVSILTYISMPWLVACACVVDIQSIHPLGISKSQSYTCFQQASPPWHASNDFFIILSLLEVKRPFQYVLDVSAITTSQQTCKFSITIW